MGIRYNTSIVRNGLVLHLDAANVKSYPGSGTVWNDLSGNKRNGTLTNGPTYNSNYMSFDGSNDYVDTNVTASTLGIYDAPYTMEAIFRVPNLTGDKMVFGNNATGTRVGMHHGVRNNTFYFGHYSADASGGTVVANTWYHGCWMWTTQSPNARIYINTNLVGSADAGSFLGTTNLRIGMSWAYSLCDIAYAKIYNRALTTTEIKQNFEALRGRYSI